MLHYPVAIISDCGGQALGRMALRVASFRSHVYVNTDFVSTCLVEASGNIVDAIDALRGFRGAVLCNSAPREAALTSNGSDIVYGYANETLVVATLATLGLVKKVFPKFTARRLNIPEFMANKGRSERSVFNFRGLEVIPEVFHAIVDLDGRLFKGTISEVSTPVEGADFPKVQPSAWLVDEIQGVPYNIKLTALCSDFPELTSGRNARALIGPDRREVNLRRYDRLTNIPPDQLGIYESSSGFGLQRFLEVAVMGGSAAERLSVKTGDRFEIVEII